jgi:endoglucanase
MTPHERERKMGTNNVSIINSVHLPAPCGSDLSTLAWLLKDGSFSILETKYANEVYGANYNDHLTFDESSSTWGVFAIRSGKLDSKSTPGSVENMAYFGTVNINKTAGKFTLVKTPFHLVDLNEIKLSDPINGGSLEGTVKVLTDSDPANWKVTTKPTTPSSGMKYTGINLSGMEFGKLWSLFSVPTGQDVQKYISTIPGCELPNTIRYPIRLAYLIPDESTLSAPSLVPDPEYMAKILNFLVQTTQQNINVILDLHCYLRYSPLGVHPTGYDSDNEATNYGMPYGKVLTPDMLEKIWDAIYTQIKSDTNINQEYLMLDLVNEPAFIEKAGTLGNNYYYGTTPTSETTAVAQCQALKKLIDSGFKGKVLLEGNSFSGLHSWSGHKENISGNESKLNSDLFSRDSLKKILVNLGASDPDSYLNQVLINVHQYFDSNFSGTHRDSLPWDQLLPDLHISDFVKWLNTNHFNAVVTEFGAGHLTSGAFGSNGKEDLNNFVALLKAQSPHGSGNPNDYGFVGWTLWGGGHSWGEYAYTLYAAPPEAGDPNSSSNVVAPYFVGGGGVSPGGNVANVTLKLGDNPQQYWAQWEVSIGKFKPTTHIVLQLVDVSDIKQCDINGSWLHPFKYTTPVIDPTNKTITFDVSEYPEGVQHFLMQVSATFSTDGSPARADQLTVKSSSYLTP